ncbi:hypothetical protein [Acinetobacter sp.]|uniref:hypothetical protein n=1 Tax=Acinetobacter sp. TaxID=472 RepID=UPI003CFC1E49
MNILNLINKIYQDSTEKSRNELFVAINEKIGDAKKPKGIVLIKVSLDTENRYASQCYYIYSGDHFDNLYPQLKRYIHNIDFKDVYYFEIQPARLFLYNRSQSCFMPVSAVQTDLFYPVSQTA